MTPVQFTNQKHRLEGNVIQYQQDTQLPITHCYKKNTSPAVHFVHKITVQASRKSENLPYKMTVLPKGVGQTCHTAA